MNNIFLFYNTDPDTLSRQAILFRDPVELISCSNKSDINRCLKSLDKAILDGYYAAGFLSYELGLYFQEIPFEERSDFPLFCFGIFSSCEKIPLENLEEIFSDMDDASSFNIENKTYSIPHDVYHNDLKHIKEHIKAGNTYQVNYTFKYKFDFKGSPGKLFSHLRKTQDIPYAGFIDLDRWSVLSLSPELFFRKTGDEIVVRPMKGTIKRGRNSEEDSLCRKNLAQSAKNKAENIMIVDLLRNDLGRISETGSVRPSSLFDIEKYRTIFQMTSTIRSRLKKGITWQEIFENIFPSGSVTGAPKKRTMEIIAETEKEPRDIYTGSMGYIAPDGNAQFNVAIRTVLIDKAAGRGTMGIGGGIVYDSLPDKEYGESLLKGAFLTNPDFTPEFDLIETLLWENEEFFLLDRHIKRLRKSAGYFSYPFDEDAVRQVLKNGSDSFAPSRKYRVRLLFKKSGECEVTSSVLGPSREGTVKIAVSDKRTDKENAFFHHKTTNRSVYDGELTKYSAKKFFDVIFLNLKGEVTEGAISNIIIQKGGNWWTPPVSSGLLAGVYREYLLETQEIPLKEKVLYLEDLLDADAVFLINSVRKMIPAIL
ncbi:MAG: aminodeoxychorismate synthase component I [Candidatus Omnitrophota bacterium]